MRNLFSSNESKMKANNQSKSFCNSQNDQIVASLCYLYDYLSVFFYKPRVSRFCHIFYYAMYETLPLNVPVELVEELRDNIGSYKRLILKKKSICLYEVNFFFNSVLNLILPKWQFRSSLMKIVWLSQTLLSFN